MPSIDNQAVREQKHIKINTSLTRLAVAVNKLESLYCDISPYPQEVEGKPSSKEPIPTLAEVLNTTSERVEMQIGRIEKIVSSIRELLF